MNKYTIRQIGILLVVLIPLGSAAAENQKLKLVTWNWPPYLQAISNQKLSGPAIDRLRCSLGRINQPYQVVFTDRHNAFRQFQSGRQQGFFPVASGAEKNVEGRISRPLIVQHWMLYSFRDTGKAFFSSSDYKQNFSIGATFGSDEWFWLKKNGYRVTKQPKGSNRLIELLLDRKVEAILLPKALMNQEFKKRNLSANSFNSIELNSQDLGVYFSQKFLDTNPGFLSSFNDALKACMPPLKEKH
ncbi:hypothetical protein EOPP23_06690 [Endozoicomonas sp. OPT23]|uniref:hypothetical protein n=1 Tax=Endozoicomonas sp. OPT23 TaxID=2072845 RepID=UPI00129A2F50|nr:hypothetical protein [Endozoicomonas sp. OPT23]MRI32674.1 hypothetical protein [Endozoicomonas sp. OPT23]